MNKKIILMICLLIMAIAFSGCVKKTDKKVTNNEAAMEEEIADDEEESFSGNIVELLKRSKAVKCTFEGEDESGKYKATTFAAGNKVRQDIVEEKNGKKTEINMIIKDQAMYVWGSDQPGEGMKMPYNASDEEVQDLGQSFKNESDKSYQNIKQKYDYKCRNWRADNSVFNEPGNINFTDLGAMMAEFQNEVAPLVGEQDKAEAPQGEMPDTLKEMCKNCDDATDEEAKVVCRAALGCE